MQDTPVKVYILDIGWLYADKKAFLDFVDILKEVRDKNVFMTDLTKVLLDIFWNENKWRIFWKIFLPYVLYLFFTIYYMVHVVCVEINDIAPWVKFFGFLNVLVIA